MSIVEMSSRKKRSSAGDDVQDKARHGDALGFRDSAQERETKIGDNDEKRRKADNELDNEIRFV